MPIKKDYLPFRYKLSLIMTCLAVVTVLSFGMLMYYQTRDFEQRQYGAQKKLLQQTILNAVRDSDITSYIMEKGIESRMRQISYRILADYERVKDINLLELDKYVSDDELLDVYIIDSDYVIRHTTDAADMNLDFKKVPGLLDLLGNVMKNGEFLADRLNITEVNKSLKKFTYLPTRDKKYIIELGADMSSYSEFMQSADVDYRSLSDSLIKVSSSLDNITRYNYRGEAYNTDSTGHAGNIDPGNLKYLEKAVQSGDVVEIEGKYKGSSAIYSYVPYQVFDAQRGDKTDVIEIIYNEREMQANLLRYKLIILLGTFGACAAAILLGSIAANILSKPIEKMVSAIDEVRKGNFDCKTSIETMDEFKLLGNSFDEMVEYVRLLLSETSKQADELIEKNREILSKNEEINTLYEETAAMNEELYGMVDQIKANYLCTVRTLSNSLEAKDKYTKGHCERVTLYSVAIGKAMGLGGEDLLNLEFAGLLHDIGKIGIPNELINKEGTLTSEEYDIIKKHPQIGYDILKDVGFLEISKRVLLQHHERVDGKGYPSGLRRENIDMMARMLAAADAYDAMTSSRPYRSRALTKEEAVQELLRNRNTQFDEEVVDTFVELINKGVFDEPGGDNIF